MIDVPVLPEHPFTRSEATAVGLSRQAISDLMAARTLRRVLRNVYVRSDIPDSLELRASAASRVVSPGAVFVDRTAAWLHGVDVFGYRDHEIPPPLECVVLRDRARIERPECVGGERDLSAGDMMRVFGLTVTTPLRTALDLGCRLPRPTALAALDQFARMHGVGRATLEASLPRYRRRRGVVKLRGLVPLVDPAAESPRESVTRLAIIDAGLPSPQTQFWVEEHGVPVFRLDLAYPRHRVAVEYDGLEWHDRTDEQRAADRARRTWLSQHGWIVIVVRRGDLSGAPREAWLRQLSAALGLA
jgi:hypothetical protein